VRSTSNALMVDIVCYSLIEFVSGCPDRPRGEREHDRHAHRLDVGRELMGDVLEHKDEQKEIEGIERPAEIARQHRAALFRGQTAQIAENAIVGSLPAAPCPFHERTYKCGPRRKFHRGPHCCHYVFAPGA
jgi:hypothetical protein